MSDVTHGMLNATANATKPVTGEDDDQTQHRCHGDEQQGQPPIDQE